MSSSSSNDKTTGFATRAIHHGYNPQDHNGALVPPVYMTSTFAFPDAATGGRRFAGEEQGYIYTRLGNPTLTLLEGRLAELESGEAALVTGSGMGAISSALWTLVKPGDEIIVDKTLYGCTFAFMRHGLSRFGVTITHVDLTDPETLRAAISDRTAVVYFESPANPNMRVVDIAAISELAHTLGRTGDDATVVIVDNTYCSPYLQQPLTLGADLVVHSATKYLGGHGDLTAGAVIGRKSMIDSIRFVGLKDMTGAVLSAMDANLILRGLKTLELRMERHCSSAQTVAEMLEAHPAVSTVYYPGLASHPQHALCQTQMKRAGGMIAFELVGGFDAGLRLMDSLSMITCAVSLGDAETLVQHPASMTHSTYTPDERAAYGISEGLIRLSVGLETPADILADLSAALDSLGNSLKVAAE